MNFPRTRVVDVCHKCSSYTWRAYTYIYAARWTLASLAFNIMMYSEQRFNKCGVKCQASAGAYVTATFAVTLIEWVCFCQKLWLFPQMQTVIIVASGALSKTLLIFKWIQNNNGDEKRHIIIAMAREVGRTTGWLMPDAWWMETVIVGGWSGYCLLSVSIDSYHWSKGKITVPIELFWCFFVVAKLTCLSYINHHYIAAVDSGLFSDSV